VHRGQYAYAILCVKNIYKRYKFQKPNGVTMKDQVWEPSFLLFY
jgi:hypothetical protein